VLGALAPDHGCRTAEVSGGFKGVAKEEEIFMSDNASQEEIERLRAENAKLKQQAVKAGTLSFRVSEKGAVSVYGLGRFPVTLYQEQWDKLLSQIDELRRFIETNRGSLKKKDV
jgi:predicted transcriptional regulator